jgi:hypothetical protein
MSRNRAGRQVWWLSLLLLVSLVACGQPAPTPFPTVASVTRVAASPTPTPAPQRYTNEIAGFSFDLPDGWQVVEQGMTQLGRYYLIGPEPLGPGPATSALFVAGVEGLAAAEAAATLACEPCETEPELEPVTIGEVEALRATLGEPVAVDWYFVSHGDWLIFFTLHDPETHLTREDLLQTFRLAEAEETVQVAGDAATATPPPTPEPLPTTPAGPGPVTRWQQVTVDGAAISFEVPETWEAVAGDEWAPDSLSPLRLGFRWLDLADDVTGVLPAGEVVASQPLTVTWGEGISVTLQTGSGWERHAVLQVGLRSYDFYTQGVAQAPVEAMQPLLEHVIASVELHDRLLYLEEPVAAAVAWFAAALEDDAGQRALPYMSEELKAQLEPEQSPLALLELPQRPTVYQLEVLGEPGRVIELQANLTLGDGSETTRILRLTFDQQIGWRLDEIVLPEE